MEKNNTDHLDTQFEFNEPTNDVAFQALRNHAAEHVRSSQSFSDNNPGINRSIKNSPRSKFNYKKVLVQILLIAGLVTLGLHLTELKHILITKDLLSKQDHSHHVVAYKLLVTSNYAQIKRGPSSIYETVGKLEVGTLLDDMSHPLVDGWYRLDYGQYIHESKVDKIPFETNVNSYKMIIVKSKVLDVYNAPHNKAKIVAQHGKGDELVLKAINPHWTKLKSGGFVKKEDLKKEHLVKKIKKQQTPRKISHTLTKLPMPSMQDKAKNSHENGWF